MLKKNKNKFRLLPPTILEHKGKYYLKYEIPNDLDGSFLTPLLVMKDMMEKAEKKYGFIAERDVHVTVDIGDRGGKEEPKQEIGFTTKAKKFKGTEYLNRVLLGIVGKKDLIAVNGKRNCLDNIAMTDLRFIVKKKKKK